MVFFVCEVCNETLKKAKIEGHLRWCPTHGMTCVDCNVTFDRLSYKSHTVCISEAEKYEGATHVPKKKRSAQDDWNELVASCVCGDAPVELTPYLPRLAELSNVPRNQKKFRNFVANSLRIRDANLADKLFDFLCAKRDAATPRFINVPSSNMQQTTTQGDALTDKKEKEEEEGKEKRKEKKKKRKESPEVASTEDIAAIEVKKARKKQMKTMGDANLGAASGKQPADQPTKKRRKSKQ
ncbi:hypothetical protein CTAYLR_008645 [Chrysophaeum taylorii]|uniref:Zinc finger C2H2 LYAR-type domain-containing protein n=1 Tax=Chrysophaeum taylorii TaxID=2483200 RepID=A0AAD7XEZ5_9STRA|nr:hypothetical protein CTAYLR_008645 [Chrysophaeum taylorii]